MASNIPSLTLKQHNGSRNVVNSVLIERSTWVGCRSCFSEVPGLGVGSLGRLSLGSYGPFRWCNLGL